MQSIWWANNRPSSSDDESDTETSATKIPSKCFCSYKSQTDTYTGREESKNSSFNVFKSISLVLMVVVVGLLVMGKYNSDFNENQQFRIQSLEYENLQLNRVKRSATNAAGQFCFADLPKLDMVRKFTGEYYYQLIDGNADTFDWFHISAPGFSNDIHLGFSKGCKSHDDEKWEIVLGGWSGTRHVIREGNQVPKYGLVKRESCSHEFCSDVDRKKRYSCAVNIYSRHFFSPKTML